MIICVFFVGKGCNVILKNKIKDLNDINKKYVNIIYVIIFELIISNMGYVCIFLFFVVRDSEIINLIFFVI